MKSCNLTIVALLATCLACSQQTAGVGADAPTATAFPTTGPLADAYDAFAGNRYRDVIVECDGTIIENPDSAEAHMLRGVAYCVCDEIYNGIESIAEAFRLNPAYQNHGQPVDRAHDYYIDAVVRLDTTSILKPRYADAFVIRALDRQRADDLDNALQCCDEALALIPAHVRATSVRSDLTRGQGPKEH